VRSCRTERSRARLIFSAAAAAAAAAVVFLLDTIGARACRMGFAIGGERVG